MIMKKRKNAKIAKVCSLKVRYNCMRLTVVEISASVQIVQYLWIKMRSRNIERNSTWFRHAKSVGNLFQPRQLLSNMKILNVVCVLGNVASVMSKYLFKISIIINTPVDAAQRTANYAIRIYWSEIMISILTHVSESIILSRKKLKSKKQYLIKKYYRKNLKNLIIYRINSARSLSLPKINQISLVVANHQDKLLRHNQKRFLTIHQSN